METAKSCRHCHSRCPYCSDAPHCFPSTTDEVAYINQDCTVIDEQIRLLQLQKANHKRRLNELQSNTRVLPPETLSEIFQHVYHNINNKKPLFQALSVCSHWHKVVLSTPSLWSKLQLSLHQDKVEGQSKLLQLWLSNVGSVPLTLELRKDCSQKGTTDPILPILTAKKNAEKIRVLKLDSASLSWASLVIQNCRHLERLLLVDLWSTQNSINLPIILPVLNLENQLRLQTLILCGSLHATIRISPSSNITTLMIQEAQDISSTLKILAQFRTLTDLRILFQPSTFPQESGYFNHLSSTHHHLRTFRINIFVGLATILEHLVLPVLESLEISVDLEDMIYYFKDLNVFRLCRVLPKSPTMFRIFCYRRNGFDHNSECFLFLCRLSSNAEQIHHLWIYIDDDNTVAKLLEFLSNELPIGTYPLPGLRKLTLKGLVKHRRWFNPLLQMMNNRKMGLHEHFCLEADLRYSWQSEQLNSLVKTLKEEGCMISVKTRLIQ